MKVLLLGSGLSEKRMGGVPAYLEDLIPALLAKGLRVTYLDPTGSRPDRRGVFWESTTRADGLETVRFHNLRTIPDYGRGTLEPRWQIHAEPAFRDAWGAWLDAARPDVAHVHEFIGFPMEACAEFKRRGIPVLATLHDFYPLCPTVKLLLPDGTACDLACRDLVCHRCCAHGQSRAEFRAQRCMERARMRRGISWISTWAWPWIRSGLQGVRRRLAPPKAYRERRQGALSLLADLDLLLANSSLAVRTFQTLGGLAHVERDPTFTRRSIRRTPPLAKEPSDGSLRVLVANVRRGPKGDRLLEQALWALPEHVARRVKVLAWACSPIKHPSVTAFPAYATEDLDAMCQRADVGLLPSLWRETYGFVGAEMLSRGLPLVASHTGAMREYVEEGRDALLFDPLDPLSLAAILTRLVEETGLLAALAEGAGHAWRKFPSFESHADALVSTYGRLLAAKRKGPSAHA